jgi:hypothetical protein
MTTKEGDAMTPSEQYDEERHARALHRRLMEVAPDAYVAAAGVGVHWHCSAVRGERFCTVHCFDDDGAEYLIYFASSAGRTRSADEAAEAVAAWLGGRELAELYARFAFVDRDLRSLRRLEAEAIALCPELEAGTSRETNHLGSDLHELWFRAGDRSCRVSHYGGNALPDAAFHWDDTELFVAAEIDVERLAPLLSRWLYGRAAPSALQKEFPWLEGGTVALAFERGEGVEGEFVASWDEVVAFYDGLPDHWARTKRDAAAFIARLRESGFDRTLRAGQSLTRLILSRSRRHGLRDSQDWIAFDFHIGEVRVSTLLDRVQQPWVIPGIDLPADLIDLLERLEARPID